MKIEGATLKKAKGIFVFGPLPRFFFTDREENTGGVEGGRLTRLRRTKTGVWETDGKDSETEPRDVGNECRLPAP